MATLQWLLLALFPVMCGLGVRHGNSRRPVTTLCPHTHTHTHTHLHPEEQFYRYLTLSNERIVQQRTRAVISLERYFLHPEVIGVCEVHLFPGLVVYGV